MLLVKNCGVNCCKSKHNLKFFNGIAIIQTWGMFEIGRRWEKNAREKCDILCPKRNPCREHRLLNVFQFFSHYITDRNTYRNDVISKTSIKENCGNKGCFNEWCFEVAETKDLKEMPWTRQNTYDFFCLCYRTKYI